MVLGGLGTDTGGSVRGPASFCGHTGLKVSFGRVPKWGCVPLGYSLDSIGPMARSAWDCAAILNVIAGADSRDVNAATTPVVDYLEGIDEGVAGLSIGVPTEYFFDHEKLEPGQKAAVEAVVTRLDELGAGVREVRLPHSDLAKEANMLTLLAEALSYHRLDMASERWTEYGANTRQIIGQAALFSAADYVPSAPGVHRLPHAGSVAVDDMPLDKAALIGCAVTTGVGAALNTAKVEPGSTVAVFGAGGIGLSAIQGARIAGARMIIAVDIIESKLGTARDFGATHSVDASSSDPVDAIRELTGGGADYTFEAIGLKIAAEQCFEAIRRGGLATIIGVMPLGQKVELDGPSFLQEKKIQGSSMGSNRFRIDMPRYIEFYQQGRLLLDEMVTRTGAG